VTAVETDLVEEVTVMTEIIAFWDAFWPAFWSAFQG